MDLFGAQKLIALTETGNLPELDLVQAFGTWWSWFSIWNGFNRAIGEDRLRAVYEHPDVITAETLPAWRSLWHRLESVGGWRWAPSLGWIHDEAHPHIYSLTFGNWIYINPQGARLDGFYFYSYADSSWYYAVDSFNGWVYRYADEDSGWRFLFE